MQIAMLLMMCFPTGAMAEGTSSITMSLNKTGASVGERISASGTTASGAWVAVKAVDGAGNIVVFDAAKADIKGSYSIDFVVPDGSSGVLAVVAGEGSNVVKKDLLIQASTGTGGGDGGGGGSPPVTATQPTISDTGKGTVSPAAGGTISLGNAVTLNIPAHALKDNKPVEVKVKEVTSATEVPSGTRILGKVYEFSIGDAQSYSFAGNVTISLKFDAGLLKPGEIPAIHYYDERKSEWVSLGGSVSGNTISVEVDHFTRFAVLAREKSPEIAGLHDISGHWAEENIRKLVERGAISGYPDGSFKPDSEISRAEFTAIIVKAFAVTPKGEKLFADTINHWAKDSIAAAASRGIVNGFNENSFGPDVSITREQMSMIIIKAAGLGQEATGLTFADKNSISSWAEASLATAVNRGIIRGYPDNTLRPLGHATRAEAVTVIVNAL